MNTLPILILALVAGYNFGSNCAFTKYKLARIRGYSLYFQTANYAVIFLLLSFLLFIFIKNNCKHVNDFLSWIEKCFGRFSDTDLTNALIVQSAFVGLLSILLSYIYLIFNFFIWLIKPLNTYVYQLALKNRDFEKLIWRAARNNTLLQVSMSNCKVYVGYVIRSIDPAADRTELRILPVLSGYRNPMGTMLFKNKYIPVLKILSTNPIEDINTDKDLDISGLGDFEIVLPYCEIRHSGLFDDEVYSQTNNAYEIKNKPIKKAKKKPLNKTKLK